MRNETDRRLAPDPLSSDEPIFEKALEHADWFNWADATAEFEEAERRFISLSEVREQLAQIREMPQVQTDPGLSLLTGIAQAHVDGELNAQDARDDWEQIEQLARAQHNQKWMNRASGERSFSEFILGHITKGRVLIATAIGTAQKTGDIAGEIRYLTGVGATLYFTRQYD